MHIEKQDAQQQQKKTEEKEMWSELVQIKIPAEE